MKITEIIQLTEFKRSSYRVTYFCKKSKEQLTEDVALYGDDKEQHAKQVVQNKMRGKGIKVEILKVDKIS